MKQADIWSLGLSLYILAYNKFPFKVEKEANELEQMEIIAN